MRTGFLKCVGGYERQYLIAPVSKEAGERY